jgi:hypothetical protein
MNLTYLSKFNKWGQGKSSFQIGDGTLSAPFLIGDFQQRKAAFL